MAEMGKVWTAICNHCVLGLETAHILPYTLCMLAVLSSELVYMCKKSVFICIQLALT